METIFAGRGKVLIAPETEIRGNVLVARLHGELDMRVSDDLRAALEAGLEQSGAAHIVFDLSDVSFIDSSGLGVILGRYRKIADRGGKMAFTGAGPAVRRVLALSGVLRISGEYEDVVQAAAELDRGGGPNEF